MKSTLKIEFSLYTFRWCSSIFNNTSLKKKFKRPPVYLQFTDLRVFFPNSRIHAQKIVFHVHAGTLSHVFTRKKILLHVFKVKKCRSRVHANHWEGGCLKYSYPMTIFQLSNINFQKYNTLFQVL